MTESTHIPPAPRGLRTRGKAFWDESMDSFEFSDSETAILVEACRCMDRLDALDKTIRDLGPMVTGSQGQPVVNPALTEARGQQQVLHRLLGALRLPDEDGNTLATARSVAASSGGYAAAQQRMRSV